MGGVGGCRGGRGGGRDSVCAAALGGSQGLQGLEKMTAWSLSWVNEEFVGTEEVPGGVQNREGGEDLRTEVRQ